MLKVINYLNKSKYDALLLSFTFINRVRQLPVCELTCQCWHKIFPPNDLKNEQVLK